MTATPHFSRPPLVLIANSEEWTSRSLESVLEPAGFALLHAFTGRQCLALAETARPDAVMVSLHLPDVNGRDVLQALRRGPDGDLTPRLAISWDAPSRRERMEAMEAGAWAIYAQPLDVDLVTHQLRTFVRMRQAHEAALTSGLLDPESGLYNARGLARRAREVGADAQRRREPLTCVAFAPEIAGLEAEASGELMDRAVARLVQVIAHSGRVSDVIGRLGHMEFAAVLPGSQADGAERLVQRLQSALGERDGVPVQGGESVPRARLRAGYAALTEIESASGDPVELILRASAALRRARAGAAGDFAMRGLESTPPAFPH